MQVFAFNQKEHLQHSLINDLWVFLSWHFTDSFWGHLKLYYVLQNEAKTGPLKKKKELLSIDWDIKGVSVLPGYVFVFWELFI